MGDELREVKTRFSFETDKKGVNRFNNTVVAMRRRIVALGALFGVALTGKGLKDLGLAAEQTEERLRGAVAAIDGNAVKTITDAVKDVQTEFNKLKVGAGDIITPSEGRLIAERFFSEFEDTGEETIGAFKQLLRTALAESIRTGEGAGEVFAKMFSDFKTGSIESLKGLPGVTAETEKRFAAITSIFSNIDFQNVAQLRVSMTRFREVLEEINPDINRFVEGVSDPLITFRATGAEAKKGFQNLGRSIVESMEGALKIVKDLFKEMNDGIGIIDAVGNAFGRLSTKTIDKGIELGPIDRAAISLAERGLDILGIDFKTDPDELNKRIDRVLQESADRRARTAGPPTPRPPSTRDLFRQAGGVGARTREQLIENVRALSPAPQDERPDRNDQLTVRIEVNGEVKNVIGRKEAIDAFGEIIDDVGNEHTPTEKP